MSEDLPQNSETNLFKERTSVEPFDTQSLTSTYDESFEVIEFEGGFKFFTEKPTQDNSKRDYRYIASEVRNEKSNEENLFTIEASGIWNLKLDPEDYSRIDLAGVNLKFRMSDPHNKYNTSPQTVILKNGSAIRVRYLPYNLETSNKIMDDLGQRKVTE